MDDLTDQDLGRELLRMAALRDFVSARYDEMHDEMCRRFGVSGVQKQTWKFPDGTELGSISVMRGKLVATIRDLRAALRWCETHYPDELTVRTEIVQEMRPAFWSTIKKASEEAGTGVDPQTGEALDWITVGRRDDTIMVRATAEAKGQMRALVESQAVQLELET